MVYLGLESVNQAMLDGYEKAQTVEDITFALKALHEHGIKAHGMFVIGADSDGPDVLRATVDFAPKHKTDTVMLNNLTPALGTVFFDEMEAMWMIRSQTGPAAPRPSWHPAGRSRWGGAACRRRRRRRRCARHRRWRCGAVRGARLWPACRACHGSAGELKATAAWPGGSLRPFR